MKHVVFGFLVIASLFAVVSWVRNPFFEFCTTRAYGWPLPWRIDYCPCDSAPDHNQERTDYPLLPWLVTTGLAGSVGIAFDKFARNQSANR